MKNFYTFSLLLITAGLVVQGCGTAESSNSIPSLGEAIPVKVMELEQVEISQSITTSGTFTTDDETTLSFKTGGLVAGIYVKEGEYVRKGQLIAKLDLTEINAQVSQAVLAFEKARRDYIRAENLYKDSVATLEQLQNAQTAMSVAEQQMKGANFNLGRSEIRAVSNGYVLKKYVNPGQMVGFGAPVVLTNGAGKTQWIFKSSISDKEWARVEIGDKAVLKTDAFGGEEIIANLIRKAEGADPLTGTFSIALEVEEEIPTGLASGLFGTATIYPSSSSRVWRIPHDALLDGNADGGYVFVTSGEGLARKIAVTMSFMDNSGIYISGGLENETRLITSGSAYLTDSSTISILP